MLAKNQEDQLLKNYKIPNTLVAKLLLKAAK